MSVARFTAEYWLARRLNLGWHWDAGVTTADQRRERLRAVVAADPHRVVGQRRGVPITAQAAYAAVYGAEEGERVA